MQLKEIFLSVMNRLSFESGNTIYIIINILDECDFDDQKTLMNVLKDICQSKSINVLIINRQGHDIFFILKFVMDFEILIQNKNVYDDIKFHIQSCLDNNLDLSR